MANAQIYEYDLINRFPTYTFNTTVNGSLTTFEALDGATIMATATTGDLFSAVFQVRSNLVGGNEVFSVLTTTQRNALIGTLDGEVILNLTTTAIERFESASWIPANQILDGNYNFQGSTKIGGDTSIDPLGALHVVGDDPTSSRIRVIRFQDTDTGSGSFQAGHSRGSEGTRNALVSGDRIGQYIYVGDNGVVEAGTGPAMRGIATENWSGTVRGSRIDFSTILNGTTDHNLAFTVSENGYPQAPTYTVATLPDVGIGGGFIFVSDETGGATLAFSDGTDWRRVQDRTIVS